MAIFLRENHSGLRPWWFSLRNPQSSPANISLVCRWIMCIYPTRTSKYCYNISQICKWNLGLKPATELCTGWPICRGNTFDDVEWCLAGWSSATVAALLLGMISQFFVNKTFSTTILCNLNHRNPWTKDNLGNHSLRETTASVAGVVSEAQKCQWGSEWGSMHNARTILKDRTHGQVTSD